jgi:hypothetical protein
LATAATSDIPDDIPPDFATILSQLTPFAARVLKEMPRAGVLRATIRATARGAVPVRGVELLHIAEHLGVPADDRLGSTLDLLVGTGVVDRAIDTPDDSNLLAMRLGPATKYSVTILGVSFLLACEPVITEERITPQQNETAPGR